MKLFESMLFQFSPRKLLIFHLLCSLLLEENQVLTESSKLTFQILNCCGSQIPGFDHSLLFISSSNFSFSSLLIDRSLCIYPPESLQPFAAPLNSYHFAELNLFGGIKFCAFFDWVFLIWSVFIFSQHVFSTQKSTSTFPNQCVYQILQFMQ